MTFRDMTAMVNVSGLQGYTALMQALGTDPAPLLRRHRIASASLTDEDALLSLRACVHLLEASAAKTGCADFGLRLSHAQDIGMLGPLAIVVQNVPTVREAWDFASRHLFMHSPGLAMGIHGESSLVDGAMEIAAEIRLPRLPAQRQTVDLCLGDMHHMTRSLAGEQYHLRAVSLPHAPLAPLSVYRQFFGAPVFAEQPRAALHVSHETLRADLQGANRVLRKITEDYVARHFRVPGEFMSIRVRRALHRTLGTSQYNKTDVAALLAIHPRTLQRHLGAEHTTFEAIRDEVRKEAALRYLHETNISLGQLADMLGYSEHSAMTRSFRRWFGTSPVLERIAALRNTQS